MKNVAKVAEVWRAQLEGQAGLAPDEKTYSPFLFHQAQRSGLILEVGAGRGRMAKVLKQNGISATLVGLDLNAEVREGPCLPVKGDARSLPFSSNSFDLVYSLGVVKHFPETDRALAEQVRILKKGGQVLVTTPRRSLFTPLRWMVWFLRERKRATFEEIRGRNLSLRQVRACLEKEGIQILSAGAFGFFPNLPPSITHGIFRLIPERIFGAYLWCLGEKVS